MLSISAIARVGIRLCIILTLVLAIGGCNFTKLSGKEPLPSISSIPLPKLPDWIEQISPVGEAEPLNQIRIRFKEPLIPVESLDSPNQEKLLQKFEISPLIPGRFRFLTPRMVGFQADRALPKATRVKVTLKSGLSDLKNHSLAQDLAWTFNTESIKLTNLPSIQNAENQSIDLNPVLQFTANVELDLASLQEHLQLIPVGKDKGVRFNVALEKSETPSQQYEQPQEKFDPSARNWLYKIKPKQTLEKSTRYHLEFGSGLRPAQGNLLTETPIITQVATYSPLQFKGIKFYGQPDAGGTYGRFIKGSPQLQFNNGILAASAIENITVNPAPKSAPKLIQAYDNENLVSLNPYALEPATTYTITIGANLKDKFGQKLGQPFTVKYETGDVAGDIWVPSGLNIFPAAKNLQLNITTVNLPDSKYKAAYRVVEPTDLVYTDSAYPKGNQNDLLPDPNSWSSFRVSGKKNQSADVAVPLQEKIGRATGMLAYGVQARTNSYEENRQQKWRELTTYGMVQLTNLGVFAQWFPESGTIRVHHLADGSPVADAAVEIYQSKLETKTRSPVSPCASGKTDINGNLIINKDDFQSCIQSETKVETAPKLLVIARENQDWAFARTDEYSGAYGFGIDAGWNNGTPESRGVIFSDRELYQPGEKAWFTGMAYYLQKGAIAQDKNASYKVSLLSPSGQKTDLGTQTTNEFGTFSLELPLKTNQPLGYYSIQAKGKNNNEIFGNFRVAEFKPPNFKVNLKLDKEVALKDDKIEAIATSNYLFGSPVEGGKFQYYVTRQPTSFIPKGWEKFSFGQQWFWPENPPVVSSDVMQSVGVLDKDGKSSQIIRLPEDTPYPMLYQVDVQIADVSNLSVSDSKTFTLLPSDRLIGLQSNFVADANKPFPVQIIVTDRTGKAIEGERVRLELQQMKYSSVAQLVEGGETAKNQIEYKTVGKLEIKSGNNPETASLTPPESGSYRLRANFGNAKNESTATDLQIWATGDNPVTWGSEEPDRLQIKLDKETYKAGETATALIQSPYPEAELYFAVVRDRPLLQKTIEVKGGAPQIQFQVTPEMLPNAAVQAVVVRQGASLNQIEVASLDKLAKTGFVPFSVNLDDKYLKTKITALQPQLQPGGEQTLQLEVQDDRGYPVKGQLTVMVVNEAVLQLSGYQPPDLVKTVYAQQPISTRFADNRANVVIQPATVTKPKGWGYGGGLSNSLANTRIRKNFQPLAYYNGSLVTDENGKATVTFKLPDDLTSWRVMAIATSASDNQNWRFGNGEASFISTKQLISNPVLPQFLRLGDRIQAGLSVTNNTAQTGNLIVNGLVSGAVKFEGNNPTSTNLQTSAPSATQAYRFPLVASSTGETLVQFTTQLNGKSDAFEVPLEVKSLAVTEQVVETGIIPRQKNEVKIPLKVDKNVVPDGGGLEISLASNSIPEISAPAKQSLENNDLPFLEPIASQLAIAANLQTLSQTSSQTFTGFNPTQQATQSLTQLQKLQMPDGGFATYPGQKNSDPFLTPYAAQTIAKVRQIWPNLVDSQMQVRLVAYLNKLLANPGQYDFCRTTLCKNQVRLEALMALSELGDRRNEFLAEIYEQRGEFDLVTQIKLGRYLAQFSEWRSEYQNLFDRLQQNLYETGRTAKVNLPQNWGWMNSATTAQAQALRLAIASDKPEIIAKLLSGLLSLRRNGTWSTTYDNAEALTALVEYNQLQPIAPKIFATAQLAGKKLGQQNLTSDRNSLDLKVPMNQLPRGQHDLILKKSGQGNLHYLAAYRYRLAGNQPGRFNGLRVGREIRQANNEKVMQKIGIYAPDKPLNVQAGQVYDIGLEVITDRPVDHLVITDPLPAGFEAIDTSLQTATTYFQSQSDSWQVNFKTIYRDRVVAYGDRLLPGVYNLHYLVRSVTPGTFFWPGAEVHLQYAPEEFGRSADSTLIISGNN